MYDVAVNNWNVEFQIRLHGELRDQWYELASKLNVVTLGEEKDKVMWRWTHIKKKLVSSVYRFLSRDECGASYARICKAKIPKKD
jgi:hypothetical protein